MLFLFFIEIRNWKFGVSKFEVYILLDLRELLDEVGNVD